jgi:hypothetical protein
VSKRLLAGTWRPAGREVDRGTSHALFELQDLVVCEEAVLVVVALTALGRATVGAAAGARPARYVGAATMQ